MRNSLLSVVVSPPDFLDLAADILDPPRWEPQDRAALEPHQVPPAGDWFMWLLEGGRGCGKTEACSRYFAAYMRQNPGARGRIIAPTFGDAVEACVTGPSGLQSVDPEVRWVPSHPGGAKVFWPNGSETLVIGTPNPRDVDRLRAGGNRHIDWWEEMAANPQLQAAWDQAAFGLRLGTRPHSIASTTPRSTGAYRKIRALAGTVFTRATMFDNPHNPQVFIDQMRARYEGTRIGRQELYGDLLTEAEPFAIIDPRVLAEAQLREWDSDPTTQLVVIGCDVARFGDDETVIAVRVGQQVRIVEAYTGRPTTDTAGRVAEIARSYPRPHVRIVVDDTGVGGGVTDQLRAAGFPVTGYNAGATAHHPLDFKNRRSELWFQLAAQLDDLDLDPDDQLAVDLTEPRYDYDLKMRRVVEQKAVTKKRIGRSPDRADAVMLTLVPAESMGAVATPSRPATVGRREQPPQHDELSDDDLLTMPM